MKSLSYDLIVVGGGPDACEAAEEGVAYGKRVALVAEYLDAAPDPSRQDAKLIDVYLGKARFVDDHCLDVSFGSRTERLEGEKFVLAVGTTAQPTSGISFDGIRVIDANQILSLPQWPESVVVVGSGATALHRSSRLARLGVPVTLVCGMHSFDEFADADVLHALLSQSEQDGVQLRLHEEAIGVDWRDGEGVRVYLSSGETVDTGCCVLTDERVGRTEHMDLFKAGLQPDERGRLWCNDNLQTWKPHIYGIGDVVGFPASAQYSLDQARRVVQHAFDPDFAGADATVYRIPTYPEIAGVGATEEQLDSRYIHWSSGIARPDWVETQGGDLLLLKVLFERETYRILGVHCVGRQAGNAIDVAKDVVSLGSRLDDMLESPISDSPFADWYEVAMQDALTTIQNVIWRAEQQSEFHHHSTSAFAPSNRRRRSELVPIP